MKDVNTVGDGLEAVIYTRYTVLTIRTAKTWQYANAAMRSIHNIQQMMSHW